MSVMIPGIAAAAFTAIFAVLYFVLGFDQRESDEAHKILWGVSLVLLTSALAASIISSILVMRRHYDDARTTVTCIMSSLVVGAAFPLTFVVCHLDLPGADRAPSRKAADSPPAGLSSGAPIDGTTPTASEIATPASDEAAAKPAGSSKEVDAVQFITPIGNVVALIAITLLVVVATWLLDQLKTCDLAEFRKRLENYRNCLQCTSLLFMAGVFEIWALFALRAKADTRFKETATAATIGGGLLLTTLLLAVFGPLTTTLHRRFEELAADGASEASKKDDEFSLETWCLENRLGDSPLGYFRSNVAILAPVASGLLIALFDRLSE